MEEMHEARYGEGAPLSLNLHVFVSPEAPHVFMFNYSVSIYLRYIACIINIIFKNLV